jgi:hypothetical protein
MISDFGFNLFQTHRKEIKSGKMVRTIGKI